MSLYDRIVGHENIVEQLQRTILQDKVNHAYIFTGAKGAGKGVLAEAFAEALLCEKQGPCGCGECPACKQMNSGNNPDYKVLRELPEKTISIGVDVIREWLVEDMPIKPYNGLRKVYVIDEAERLTPQAMNAMLKTIEEPPSYGVVILLTTNIERLLSTIRSRCVTYELRPLRDSVITEYLIKNRHIPDYEAKMCAAFSQGYLGRALELQDSGNFTAMREAVLNLIRTVYTADIVDVMDDVKKLNEYKSNFSDVLDLLAVRFRDVLMFKVTKDPNRVIFADEINLVRKQSSHSSYEGLENILKALEVAKVRLAANVNFDVAIELLLLNIKEN